MLRHTRRSSARRTRASWSPSAQGRSTQPGSAVSGEAVGAFVAGLLSDDGGALHGRSLHLTAAAFVSMVVPIIVFLALQRYFVRGITGGAVKG